MISPKQAAAAERKQGKGRDREKECAVPGLQPFIMLWENSLAGLQRLFPEFVLHQRVTQLSLLGPVFSIF